MSMLDRIAKAMLAGKPGGPHPGGIHVYHSSPYDFDKFDWSKLRTGEGANTYGVGFYFAENPKVSGQGGEYWNNFLGRFQGPEQVAAKYLGYAKYDREAARQALAEAMKADRADPAGYGASIIGKRLEQQDLAALELLKGNAPVGPRTYEVNIAARPELMLDWDKPIGQQPKAVQELAADVIRNPGRGAGFVAGPVTESMPISGGNLYKAMAARSGKPDDFMLPGNAGDLYASGQLRDAGIPGIRYLDAGSRPVGEGSSNYVVFNTDLLNILNKYGVAGGAAVPVMGGAFDQSTYEARQ